MQAAPIHGAVPRLAAWLNKARSQVTSKQPDREVHRHRSISLPVKQFHHRPQRRSHRCASDVTEIHDERELTPHPLSTQREVIASSFSASVSVAILVQVAVGNPWRIEPNCSIRITIRFCSVQWLESQARSHVEHLHVDPLCDLTPSSQGWSTACLVVEAWIHR